MTSKKGSNANQGSGANVASALPNSTGSASTRGNISSKGVATAKQFLSARWRAVEGAANDASLNASEKPEIHQEKAPSIASGQQVKSSGQQVKTGSAWGRRK